MASQLRQKRLRNEYDEAVEALEEQDEERIDPSIKAILPTTTSTNTVDLSEWIIVFEGKDCTALEGGNYKLRILAGDKYPYEPPEVWVMDGFEHFHVFAGGKVCFKLLNKENWKLGYTILMLVNCIIRMLHSDPEVSDPASTTLTRLVERGERFHQPNLKEYNSFLRGQAKRFANRYQHDIQQFRKEHDLPLAQKQPNYMDFDQDQT